MVWWGLSGDEVMIIFIWESLRSYLLFSKNKSINNIITICHCYYLFLFMVFMYDRNMLAGYRKSLNPYCFFVSNDNKQDLLLCIFIVVKFNILYLSVVKFPLINFFLISTFLFLLHRIYINKLILFFIGIFISLNIS